MQSASRGRLRARGVRLRLRGLCLSARAAAFHRSPPVSAEHLRRRLAADPSATGVSEEQLSPPPSPVTAARLASPATSRRLPALRRLAARAPSHHLRAGPRRRRPRHRPSRRDHQDGARVPDRAGRVTVQLRLLRPRPARAARQPGPSAADQRLRYRRQAREDHDREAARRRRVAVENPIGYFSAVRAVTFNVPEGTRPASSRSSSASTRRRRAPARPQRIPPKCHLRAMPEGCFQHDPEQRRSLAQSKTPRHPGV